MNKSVYRMSLDLHRSVSPHVLSVKQGDTAREMRITLTEDGKPYAVADDCSAECVAKLADGTVASFSLSAADNVLSGTVPPTWVVAEGMAECEIRVTKNDGTLVLSSPRFGILVSGALGIAASPLAIYFGYVPTRSVAEIDVGRMKSAFPLSVASKVHVEGDPGSNILAVLVPDELGITLGNSDFVCDDPGASGAFSSTTNPFTGKDGVTRAYDVYWTFKTAAGWTVCLPAAEGEE